MNWSSHRWKILGILLLVVVAVTSVGSYAIWNKPIGQKTTSLASTSLIQATVVATSAQTSSTTAVSLSPIQWITVGKVRPVNYYLTLLQSNGTQPYVRLGEELRRLPDLTNATAVATITYLALNATNPEVKQALELMINDGTPAPGNFSYSVPTYNTELEILYWLAAQNILKKDDTLALAIAMTNGLWITMGDNAVITDVHTQVSERLILGREINEFQAAKNLDYSLENSSLLAKIMWSWPGNENGVFGARLIDYFLKGVKVADSVYRSIAVSPDQLRAMRQFMLEKGLVAATADETISNLEEYLWFDPQGNLVFPNWTYSDQLKIHDAGFLAGLLISTGKGEGDCNSEYTVVDTAAKSIGIPTTAIFRNVYDAQGKFVMGHMHAIYYDSQSNSWKAYRYQLEKGDGNRPLGEAVRLFIMRVPVDYSSYFWEKHDTVDTVASGHHYVIPSISRGNVALMFERGIPDSEMENYLL